MARVAENDPLRLRTPLVAVTERKGRTVELPAGTVGTVLLDHRRAYEVEFVLAPADPAAWADTDYVIAVLEDDQVEALPRSERGRV